MDFPTIQTNFWDAVIAVPVVMIMTQLLKMMIKIPKKYVPTIALALGLLISVFISHRHSLVAGLFMGWFLRLFSHWFLCFYENNDFNFS